MLCLQYSIISPQMQSPLSNHQLNTQHSVEIAKTTLCPVFLFSLNLIINYSQKTTVGNRFVKV